jgi:hypothetical protein
MNEYRENKGEKKKKRKKRRVDFGRKLKSDKVEQ